jgi:hypothetical protein
LFGLIGLANLFRKPQPTTTVYEGETDPNNTGMIGHSDRRY